MRKIQLVLSERGRQKKVIFMDGLGAVNLKPEWLLKMEPAWLGMTLPEFQLRSMAVLYQSVSQPYPSVSTSLSLLSLLSLSVVNGNMHSGCGHFFFQFDILNVWTWSEEGTLASLAILPVCILSPSSFRCIVPAHFLQATAFQHCKPVRGAHCKDVVPIAS